MQIFREIPFIKPQNDTSKPFCAWIYIHLFFLFGKILLYINGGGGGGGGGGSVKINARLCSA